MELRKVGRTELGRINLDTGALEVFKPNLLHYQKDRKIRAKVSRTRNNLWRSKKLGNHGFPNIIEIGNENFETKSPKDLSPHKLSIWYLETIFEMGRAENDEIKNLHFHFNHKHKTLKKILCHIIYVT